MIFLKNQDHTEDPSIFIRGFRVVRPFGVLPKQLRGAAGPDSTLHGDGDDDDVPMDLISLPGATTVRYSYEIGVFLPLLNLQSIATPSICYQSTLSM
jgi:hypothetical protein